MHCVPLLSNPVGWLILGVASYFLYKSGKNAGKQEAEENKSEISGKALAEKPAKA
jgi:hypothetical protein